MTLHGAELSASRFVCFIFSKWVLKDIKIIIHKTIILPVVLYECETWSLTLKEEHRLRVFENRVLRNILSEER
jgi:hypothetical protein